MNSGLALYDFPIRLFKLPDEKGNLFEIKPETNRGELTGRERLLLCRFCGHGITSPADMTEMNGKLNHTFTNPAGNSFTIACFVSAKGCLTYGEPTYEHTWFPGFSWTYALCSGCQSHLGWYYSSKGTGFFGLILNHLAENL